MKKVSTKYGPQDRGDVSFWRPFYERYLAGESYRELSPIIGISDVSLAQIFKNLFPPKSRELKQQQAKEKRLLTNLKKYGSEHPMKNPQVIKKTQETILQKYGEGRKEVARRIQKTKDLYSQERKAEIQKKSKATNLVRYGRENPFQVPAFIEKAKNTLETKLGVRHVSQSPEWKNQMRKTIHIDKSLMWEEVFKKEGFELLEPYRGVTLGASHIKYKMKHLACGKVLARDLLRRPTCGCNNPWGSSKKEQELAKTIQDLLPDVEVELRKKIPVAPKKTVEVDIFIPSLKKAFEYNGTFYHCSAFKRKNFHRDKSQVLLNQGIELFHVWEFKNPDIVRSRIAHILGVTRTAIQARKCITHNLSAKEAKAFLEKNHIDGFAKSSRHIGLFHEGSLVAVLSLRKHPKYDWEIARFAIQKNTKITGAFKKLLRALQDQGLSGTLLTYADRDWTPNPYKSLYSGFKLEGETPPRLYFTDGTRVYPREKFQRHKLDFIQAGETTEQGLARRNIFAIYTSGNWKFTGIL